MNKIYTSRLSIIIYLIVIEQKLPRKSHLSRTIHLIRFLNVYPAFRSWMVGGIILPKNKEKIIG